jgi:hypothetical protein
VLLIKAKAKELVGQKGEALEAAQGAVAELIKHDPNEPQWLTRQKAQVHLDAAELYLQKLKG